MVRLRLRSRKQTGQGNKKIMVRLKSRKQTGQGNKYRSW